MQKRINNKSSDGVRIYSKRRFRRNRNKTETKKSSSFSDSFKSKDSNSKDTGDSAQLSDSNIKSRQLETTQQILDTLSDQFNSLNGSKQSKCNSVLSSEYNNTSREILGYYVSIDDLSSITNKQKAPRHTQQALNDYIKYNIENSDEFCGCHFERNCEESDNLSDESDESCRKQNLSANKQYSNLQRIHGGSETSIRDDSVPFICCNHFRHTTSTAQQQQQESKSSKRLNHGLFIDKNSKQCHSSVNIIDSKRDKAIEQVNEILNERQGPCCNHQAKLQQKEQYCNNNHRTRLEDKNLRPILNKKEFSKEIYNHPVITLQQQQQQESNESYLLEGDSNNQNASFKFDKYKFYYSNQIGEELNKREGDEEEVSYEVICETGNALESLTDSIEDGCIDALLFQDNAASEAVQTTQCSDAGELLVQSNLDYCSDCLRLHESPLGHCDGLAENNFSNSIISLSCSRESQFDDLGDHFQELQNILDLDKNCPANCKHCEQSQLGYQNERSNCIDIDDNCLKRAEYLASRHHSFTHCLDQFESASSISAQIIHRIEEKIKRRPLGECFSCEDLSVHKMGLDCNESSDEKCNTTKSESNIINSPESKSMNANVAHLTKDTHSRRQTATEKEQNSDNLNRSTDPNNSLNSNLSNEEVRLKEGKRSPFKKHSLRGLSSLENVKSMRAVKDIMKMSVPSLSSLQYLPSQIDSAKKVNAKSNKQPDESNKIASKLKVVKGEVPIKPLENMNNTTNKIMIVTESEENLKHDESCLFNRLCLCNCISRGHHYMPGTTVESASTLEVNNQEENQSKEESLQNLKTVKRSKSCLSESSDEDEKVSNRTDGFSRERKTSSMREYEKQSPSFLSLLKSSSSPSPTHIPSSRNNYTSSPYSSQRVRGSKNIVHMSNRSGRIQDNQSLGSELTASASSSRNSATTDDGDSRSSSYLRARSTSFNSSQNHQETPLNSFLYEDVSSDNVGTRPQSACSIRESIKSRIKKGTNYRKLLSSPSRFFSHSPSYDKTEESEQQQVSSELKNIRDHHHEKSFFSRSFNRLSNRTRRNKKNWFGNKLGADNQVTDLNQLSRACVSPTISISTASNIDHASLEDSVNSLDEITLPLEASENSATDGKFQDSILPQVFRNKVEYLNAIDIDDSKSKHSAISCDMTRAKSYKYSHDKRIHRNIYHGSSSPTRQYPARYGSEISGFSATTSDIISGERAYSLPPSPRGSRSRIAPIVGANRSPRLTHSPIPFHSPATQSTKIEDGLKVCSTEHFEKHIGNIKEIQLEAQKKLFKAWINYFCPNLIRDDLVEELQDGIKLIGMLAYLTRDRKLFSHYDKLLSDKQSYLNRIVVTHSSRLRHLSNVSIAIDYLRRERKMKLINLNPMDIVCGKANVILGLCWNIILNFQLEQNYLKYLEKCDDIASQNSLNSETNANTTSCLFSTTNEDCAKYVKKSIRDIHGQILEEYTPNELVKARKRLLDHINRRFNLKLTNLTSNLLDGEVLFVIIKILIPECSDESQLMQNNEGKLWKSMNNDEKLDHCFDLALAHLNVPRLFSSVDLRQQTISDNNSKPLLVYLTMLLGTDSGEKNIREDDSNVFQSNANHDSLRNTEGEEEFHNYEITKKIEAHLEELEKDDRFEVDKLQLTLRRLKKLEELLCNEVEQSNTLVNQEHLKIRYSKLKDEAEEVESLISWINQADALFETPQKSAQDLNNSIEIYKNYFSPNNVPQIRATLCPTLERQYRECISTAQQRVHIMEQTLKNWTSYEKARKLLRDWLVTAEVKLTNALLPVKTSLDNDDGDDGDDDADSVLKPIEQHTDRLEDLIEYFELEPIDSILYETSQDFNRDSITSPTFRRPNVSKVSDSDGLPLSLSFSGDKSKSGSLLSISSASSRMSTLQNCKKASYYNLFDDFELKCRLLAAMLDSDQREALLLGVKELRSRLKYITEQRVPQVVSELKWNINCCEMTIEEQDENSDVSSIDGITKGGEEDEDENEEASPIKTNNIATDIENRTEILSNENEDLRDDSGCFLKYQGTPTPKDNDLTTSNQVTQLNKPGKRESEHLTQPTKSSSSVKVESKSSKNKKIQGANKEKSNKNSMSNRIQNHQKPSKVESKDSESPWSFFSWLLSREPKPNVELKQSKSKKSLLTSSRRNRKSRSGVKNTKIRSKQADINEPVKDATDELSYTSLLWHKVIRAYRASFSLNIVLLICLTGICVIPLIHKDACCELTSGNIPPSDFSMSEKPT